MPREIRTAEEIREEIQRLINESRPTGLVVPLPIPVPREAGSARANWDLPQSFRRTPGFQIDIGLALVAVQKRWDLKTE